MIKPTLLRHKICYWNPELCLCIRTVKYLYHQQILVHDLKPCPQFLYWLCWDKHWMLLIKSFIRVKPRFINNNKSLLPSAEDLWFFEYFAINEGIFYNWFRHSRNAFFQLIEFEPHLCQLFGDDGGKDNVMDGEFFLFEILKIFWGCDHHLLRMVADFDSEQILTNNCRNGLEFVYVRKIISLGIYEDGFLVSR